jgi:hypothetical protein
MNEARLKINSISRYHYALLTTQLQLRQNETDINLIPAQERLPAIIHE